MRRAIGSRVVRWLVIVAMCTFPMQGFALTVNTKDITNDAVTSQKINEADGTSLQDTNSGNGVKTGHIQDGAVTASKLGIVCPTGNYLQYVTGSGWLCTPHYANVIVVAKSGGDFTDLVAAVNSISDASATNPYQVKIMPGIFQIVSTINLKNYVYIEGSGPDVTIINSARVLDTFFSSFDSTDIGISNMTLDGSNAEINCIRVIRSAKFNIKNVDIFNKVGIFHNAAIACQEVNALTIKNVNINMNNPYGNGDGLSIINYDDSGLQPRQRLTT